MRFFSTAAAITLAFLAGAAVMHHYSKPNRQPRVVSSDVLLEQTRRTLKLSVVEGDFTEIYTAKDYQYFDFWPFRKQVLLRVKAKALVGFDFDKCKISLDSLERVVRVVCHTDPEILSIDHTVDYYDISEGLFNSFSPSDYNRIHSDAKERIRTSVMNSQLFDSARQQLKQTITQLEQLLLLTGWKLIFEQAPSQSQLDG